MGSGGPHRGQTRRPLLALPEGRRTDAAAEQLRDEEVTVGPRLPEAAVGVRVTNVTQLRRCNSYKPSHCDYVRFLRNNSK